MHSPHVFLLNRKPARIECSKLNCASLQVQFLNPELVLQKMFNNTPVRKENGKLLWGGSMNQFTDADSVSVVCSRTLQPDSTKTEVLLKNKYPRGQGAGFSKT